MNHFLKEGGMKKSVCDLSQLPLFLPERKIWNKVSEVKLFKQTIMRRWKFFKRVYAGKLLVTMTKWTS